MGAVTRYFGTVLNPHNQEQQLQVMTRWSSQTFLMRAGSLPLLRHTTACRHRYSSILIRRDHRPQSLHRLLTHSTIPFWLSLAFLKNLQEPSPRRGIDYLTIGLGFQSAQLSFTDSLKTAMNLPDHRFVICDTCRFLPSRSIRLVLSGSFKRSTSMGPSLYIFPARYYLWST